MLLDSCAYDDAPTPEEDIEHVRVFNAVKACAYADDTTLKNDIGQIRVVDQMPV